MEGKINSIVTLLWEATKHPERTDAIVEHVRETYGIDVEYVGEGSSRAVWRVADKYALKVANDDVGILQNQIEYSTWESLHNDDREYFAEIYERSQDNTWILCEYVEPQPEAQERVHLWFDQLASQLRDLADRYNLYYNDLIDDEFDVVSEDNVVVFGDSFKIVDYGCDPDLYEEFYKLF